MGGSPSKKENFPEISLSQETIDQLYSSFETISKLKDGSSSEFIGQKGMGHIMRPNKQLGSKLTKFLAEDKEKLTINFKQFLLLGEYFIDQKSSNIYSQYSPLEFFGIISLYSIELKDKYKEKYQQNNLSVSFRDALEFLKELSGIVGAYFGKYILERDESLSMQMTKKIYGHKNEMTFMEFMTAVSTQLPKASLLISSYFIKLFLEASKLKGDISNRKDGENDLLSNSVMSKLGLFVNQFEIFFESKRVYSGKEENFQYQKFRKTIEKYRECDGSVLILINHLIIKEGKDDDFLENENNFTKSGLLQQQSQCIGIFIPGNSEKFQESFFQLDPIIKVYKNPNRTNFIDVGPQSTIVLYGENDTNILCLSDNLKDQSYMQSQQTLGFFQTKPFFLRIEEIEIWVSNQFQAKQEEEQISRFSCTLPTNYSEGEKDRLSVKDNTISSSYKNYLSEPTPSSQFDLYSSCDMKYGLNAKELSKGNSANLQNNNTLTFNSALPSNNTLPYCNTYPYNNLLPSNSTLSFSNPLPYNSTLQYNPLLPYSTSTISYTNYSPILSNQNYFQPLSNSSITSISNSNMANPYLASSYQISPIQELNQNKSPSSDEKNLKFRPQKTNGLPSYLSSFRKIDTRKPSIPLKGYDYKFIKLYKCE